MTNFAQQLEKDDSSPTTYEKAVSLLRQISANGFAPEAKKAEGKNLVMFGFDEEDMSAAHLVHAAAYITDRCVHAEIDSDEGYVALEFPKEMEKPPVRTMRDNLDKLKNYILNECLSHDAETDTYTITDPHKLPINPFQLVLKFIEEGEACSATYQLPRGTLFIDSDGLRHSDQKPVDAIVMMEYLDQHQPGKKLFDFNPIEMHVAPATIDRMLTQLNMVPKKGAYLS